MLGIAVAISGSGAALALLVVVVPLALAVRRRGWLLAYQMLLWGLAVLGLPLATAGVVLASGPPICF